MTWTNIWYGFAHFFEFCFKIIKKLQQFPNVTMGTIIVFLLAYWTIQIRKQNKQAERDGTYL